MKRAIDIVAALLALILFSPLMAMIGLVIRIKMGKPIFFIQQRPGFQGKPFNLYKFRTMASNRDARGRLLSDEARVTPLGNVLRKYSLDELPQLFNILKGDLSLVGPRPLLMEYLPLYTPRQAKRHQVKPGLTGWAQINGRNTISWDEKFELDVWYVENRSLILDIKILIKTVEKVLRSEGINQPGKATVENFNGSKITSKEG
ncbi:sugar transferase [Siminovitchia sediminis]|uniref:Sugar transferase n=1 Tax=Siminovitchia sediminis TaxID=1274353 RepID=A0ABW4KIL6_9BACI